MGAGLARRPGAGGGGGIDHPAGGGLCDVNTQHEKGQCTAGALARGQHRLFGFDADCERAIPEQRGQPAFGCAGFRFGAGFWLFVGPDHAPDAAGKASVGQALDPFRVVLAVFAGVDVRVVTARQPAGGFVRAGQRVLQRWHGYRHEFEPGLADCLEASEGVGEVER